MNMKSLLLSLTIILSASACVNARDNAVSDTGFTLKITTNLPDESLVILSRITDTKLDIKDSAYVKKGALNFAGDAAEESSLYYITFGSPQPPGIPLILESGANVKMSITKAAPYEVTMEGGLYNVEMLKLYKTYTQFEATMAKFNAEIAGLDPTTVTPELRTRTNQRYEALVKKRSKNI